MSDKFLAEAKAQFRRMMDDMPPEERAAWIAKMMAGEAFAPHGALPRELMAAVHGTIDALARATALEPPALAIEAFRRHGYRASLEDKADIALLRVERLQS
ncbi:hypothetical protein [Salinarimonas soli]|uniref:Uncharacterized protein n=1 Tax=Salinarimonas soli TaxID=1638099 RepID=A0A5B2V8M4_9HYPH|nr:hypothetical protein [Salinarimonas soli]KAA2234679.1 hypothetical protein F0L46_23225 [Salinarimonas soli]